MPELASRLTDPLQKAGVQLSDAQENQLAADITATRDKPGVGIITNFDQLRGTNGLTPQVLTVLNQECYLSPYTALMSARPQGIKNAAPTPCKARAAISAPGFGASPQAIDANAKTLTPIIKIRRRPKRSPAAPPISSNADMHSVYALITHCIAESEVFKSASMRGNATLTTDSSTKAIVDASTAQMSTQRFW